MSWNAHQQAMLEAIGYTLWRAAGAASHVAETPAGPVVADADARVAASNANAGDDPLLRALRRAAGGRDPSPLLPPLDQLRGDAAAKRALWPRLRALRRR